jgi:hypothetical protein
VHKEDTLSWNAHALAANDLTPTKRPGGVAIDDVYETLTDGAATAFVEALFVDAKHVAPLMHVTFDANACELT